MSQPATRLFHAQRHVQSPADAGSSSLSAELEFTDVWSDEMVAAAGIPVIESPLVSVGGGIGSFVLIDYLRIAGVPTASMRVLSDLDHPWQTYEYLTKVSQIPREERLRSDSSSTPDNIWGFPSYAVREALSARTPRALFAPIVQVLTEPVLADYYTPRAGQVFKALERESSRISFPEMQVKGMVKLVRRRQGGGYFSLLRPPSGTSATTYVAYRSQYLHLAVGYPGLQFLSDLQNYRREHPQFHRVVNAYEPHEHVYEALQHKPGTVLIRGGGIVASRVLQRLIDDRDRLGTQVQIVHLFRTYVSGSHGPSIFQRRRGGNGWAYQGFNYPKSAWGGQLKAKMRRLEGEDRAALYKVIGGTNTPYRRRWQEQLDRGRREGFYSTVTGQVTEHAARPGRPADHSRLDRSGEARDLRGLHHRLHRARGGHCRAPSPRRPAAALRRRSQPPQPPRCRAQLRGARDTQRERSDVRLGRGHPRGLLPRGRHLPGVADRGSGNL